TTLAKIERALQTKPMELSLDDATDWEDRTPLSDRLVDEDSASPEEEVLREETQELISLVLKDLKPQERAVIIGRFGLGGEEALTLRQIGKRLGVTAERVRQVELQAMARLRLIISRRAKLAANSRLDASSAPPG